MSEEHANLDGIRYRRRTWLPPIVALIRLRTEASWRTYLCYTARAESTNPVLDPPPRVSPCHATQISSQVVRICRLRGRAGWAEPGGLEAWGCVGRAGRSFCLGGTSCLTATTVKAINLSGWHKTRSVLKPGRSRDDNWDWLAKVKPRRGRRERQNGGIGSEARGDQASSPGKTRPTNRCHVLPT